MNKKEKFGKTAASGDDKSINNDHFFPSYGGITQTLVYQFHNFAIGKEKGIF